MCICDHIEGPGVVDGRATEAVQFIPFVLYLSCCTVMLSYMYMYIIYRTDNHHQQAAGVGVEGVPAVKSHTVNIIKSIYFTCRPVYIRFRLATSYSTQ